jgi:hypothetical protein
LSDLDVNPGRMFGESGMVLLKELERLLEDSQPTGDS